ncbi:MAG: hypothetical protein AAB614_03090 [Patescibacteria group bacterium]
MLNINKIKKWVLENKERGILFIQFVLVGAIFFGLGTLYEGNRILSQKSLIIGKNEQILSTISQFNTKINGLKEENNSTAKNYLKTVSLSQKDLNGDKNFQFVASKNGKTYYRISCSNRIKDENKIYFETEENAKKSGLIRSKTCFK